jgi:hypothetical protein
MVKFEKSKSAQEFLYEQGSAMGGKAVGDSKTKKNGSKGPDFPIFF